MMIWMRKRSGVSIGVPADGRLNTADDMHGTFVIRRECVWETLRGSIAMHEQYTYVCMYA